MMSWKVKGINMRSLEELSRRGTVPIYAKMKPKEEASHLVNSKPMKEYSYYKCDYCEEEIKILDKKQEMTGGVVTFRHIVTKHGDIEMALHNKCLKPVLKIFEE